MKGTHILDHIDYTLKQAKLIGKSVETIIIHEELKQALEEQLAELYPYKAPQQASKVFTTEVTKLFDIPVSFRAKAYFVHGQGDGELFPIQVILQHDV